MKKLNRFKTVVAAVAIGSAVIAGTAPTVGAESPAISGYIESTYMYDFSNPNSGVTALRSYDATANSFYLNAAHVAFTGELERGVGYTVEVDYGSDANVNNNVAGPGAPAAADANVDIQEAYLTFPVGPLSLTAGKFVTYEGIEVIEGPYNPTISRGYLFGLAEAFTHVGAKAHIGLGETLNLGVGLVNGRDVDVDTNEGKTAIWRLGVDLGEALSFGISGSHGPANARDTTSNADHDNLTSHDLTGTLSVIPRLPISFQVLYAEMDNAKAGTSLVGKWSGAGIQPVLEVSEAFSVGARVEYFDDLDRNNFTAVNYTVSPAYRVNDAVTVRGEVRVDEVNMTGGAMGPFVDDKGTLEDSTTTASLSFVYLFGD